MNNNILNMIDGIINKKENENKFSLEFLYNITMGGYDYNTQKDWESTNKHYALYYNGKKVIVYDEKDSPTAVHVDIDDNNKHICVYTPYMKEGYRNGEIALQGIEYITVLMDILYHDKGYELEFYYCD